MELEEGELEDLERPPNAVVGEVPKRSHSLSSREFTRCYRRHVTAPPSSVSSSRDRAFNDSSSFPSSQKRKREDSETIFGYQTDSSMDSINAFIKMKKAEVVKKLKDQLTFGAKSVSESIDHPVWSNENDSNIRPESNQSTDKTKKRKRKARRSSHAKHVRKASNDNVVDCPKYYDFDKVEKPSETTLSNWTKTRLQKVENPKILESCNTAMTSSDDMWTRCVWIQPPIDDNTKIDKNPTEFTNSKDQDYRTVSNNRPDVNYRPVVVKNDYRGFHSSNETSYEDDYSKEKKSPFVNEYGDVDYRDEKFKGDYSKDGFIAQSASKQIIKVEEVVPIIEIVDCDVREQEMSLSMSSPEMSPRNDNVSMATSSYEPYNIGSNFNSSKVSRPFCNGMSTDFPDLSRPPPPIPPSYQSRAISGLSHYRGYWARPPPVITRRYGCDVRGSPV